MELIVFPIAFAYFLWLHSRDKRKSAHRAALPKKDIELTLLITRDDAGRICKIRVA